MTVTSVTANQLSQANVQTLSDVQNVTSGFRLDNHEGIYQPTIRGITTGTLCVACGNNVGVYEDGFYDPQPMSLDLQLFNVDNVQVLKGPQGTLFGQNTVGGAVLITTTPPSTQTQGFAEASYGSYHAQQYKVYATTGLSDTVAVDVGAWLKNGDGWVDNVATNNTKFGQYQDWGFHTGMNIDVTDALSFLLRYNHVNVDDPTGIIDVPFVRNGQVLDYGITLPGAIEATQRGTVSADLPIIEQYHSDSYQLTGTLDLAFGTLKSYSQYRKDEMPTWYQSYDYVNLPLLQLNIPDRVTTITQEFLLTSKSGGPLQWDAGAVYYDSTGAYTNVAQQTTGPLIPYTSTGADGRSAAVYGNATYGVLDKLFLSIGLRYTHDEMVDPYWILAGIRTELPALTDNRVTPRVSIRYAITASSSLYATYASGYKAALWNTGGFQTTPVKPEELSSYEVGYKYAANWLLFDLSGFHYNYTNEQIASETVTNGVTASVDTNAASSHMYGMDADTRVRLAEHVDLSAGLEWLHATYQSFPDAPGFTVLPNGLEPTTVVNASGNQMQRSPDFTANLGVTYTTSFVGGSLALSATVYHTSRFYFDPANQLPQDAYTTLGLRAEWTDPSGRYVLSIAGDNVTNTKYYTSASQIIYGAGATWGAPAMVMGTIRVNFH